MNRKSSILFLSLLLGLFVSRDPAQDAELVVQTGHGSAVTSVAFSPSGKVLASGGSRVKLHDVATGKELRTMTLHASRVWSLAYSPDGAIVASGGFDITLHRTTTGETVGAMRGHGYGVTALAFSPDSKVLASGDRSVWLWEVAKFKPAVGFWDTEPAHDGIELKGHSQPVTAIAFSPDGKVLASASQDGTVILWNIADRTVLRTLVGHRGIVTSIAFGRDGRLLVSGGEDKTVRLWDVSSGSELALFAGHSDRVNSVAIDAEGNLIASGGGDSTIKIWDLRSKQLLRTVSGHTGPVLSVAFAPTGDQIASGGQDQTVRLWDGPRTKFSRVISGPYSVVSSVAFTVDGKTLASGGSCITLWDLMDGKDLKVFARGSKFIEALAFSYDGKIIASSEGAGPINLWNVASGEIVRTIDVKPANAPVAGSADDNIWILAFSPVGDKLASITHKGLTKIWEVSSGTQLDSIDRYAPGGREKAEAIIPQLKDKLPALIATSEDLIAKPSMEFNSIELMRVVTYEPLVKLVALDERHWVMTSFHGPFDTNQDFEAIDGVHWVGADDPFKPLPLEIFMRQYYEPALLPRILRCTRNNTCRIEFRPLPGIADLNRVQPRLGSPKINRVRPRVGKPKGPAPLQE